MLEIMLFVVWPGLIAAFCAVIASILLTCVGLLKLVTLLYHGWRPTANLVLLLYMLMAVLIYFSVEVVAAATQSARGAGTVILMLLIGGGVFLNSWRQKSGRKKIYV